MSGRISKEKASAPPEHPGPRDMPVAVSATWMKTCEPDAGWCSICHGLITEGVHVYKTADLQNGAFDHSISHHVVCVECVNVLATAAFDVFVAAESKRLREQS